MQANANRTYEPVAARDGGERAVKLAGASDSRTPLRTRNEDGSAGNSPIAPARALLIYLKHWGVLNVEEFRRTRTRTRDR